MDLVAEYVIQLAQTIQIQVEDGHVRSEPNRNFGRIGTDRTTADNGHFAAADARHAG
ncbi:hypothetical protein D3C76_1882450 [compost metagenome]